MTSAPPFDLKARARQAMFELGFAPDLPPEALREAQTASRATFESSAPPPPGTPAPVDLRSLLWSSIDNNDSRDLDQIEYAETLPDGAVRLLVGIADVDSLAPRDSAIDRHAACNTTTVYTGVSIFPMLPADLSIDRTSLLDGCDRRVMVVELRIPHSGTVDCHSVYPAWVRNRAKLAYPSVGDWLEGRGPLPPAIAAVPGMEAQIRLQHETSLRLRQVRKDHGALTFASLEARPVVEDGEVKDLVVARHNPAMDIIESFMVAANVAMARHLKDRQRLSIRRVVRTPKRWERIVELAATLHFKLPVDPEPKPLQEFLDAQQRADPAHFPDLSLAVVKLLGPGEYIVEAPGRELEGHFGLAVQDYTHSTAPNRRYADLITQRLLKAVVAGAPEPYDEPALAVIAARCSEREKAASKVERLMRKVIACVILSSRIGETFDGFITGCSPKGTYVRLQKFPAEGMVIKGTRGVDVGDLVRVRLVSMDIARGFINFERI